MDGFPPEVTEDDLKEHYRLCKLYRNLTGDERRFIVSQWDEQHGLEDWNSRLEKKEKQEANRKKRAIFITLGIIIIFCVSSHFAQKYEEGQRAISHLDYIYKKADENPSLYKNLKWIEEELELIRAELYDEIPDLGP